VPLSLERSEDLSNRYRTIGLEDPYADVGYGAAHHILPVPGRVQKRLYGDTRYHIEIVARALEDVLGHHSRIEPEHLNSFSSGFATCGGRSMGKVVEPSHLAGMLTSSPYQRHMPLQTGKSVSPASLVGE